jgi:WD40 repeat protein
LAGHQDVLNDLVLSPNGRLAASVSQDNEILLWDLDTGTAQGSLIGHEELVRFLVVTPDGRRLVSGSDDSTIKVWDLENCMERFTLTGHSQGVSILAITPDGRRLVSGSRDQTIKIWDLADGSLQSSLLGHSEGINELVITPDGRLLVSTSSSILIVWDLLRGGMLVTYKPYSGFCKPEFVFEPFRLVIGDDTGQMHFLVPEGLGLECGKGNMPFDSPLVTAFRAEEVSPALAFGCPFCRTWSGISEAELGTGISCPKCRKAVRLNPFSIDGDWRGIARCWMGGG